MMQTNLQLDLAFNYLENTGTTSSLPEKREQERPHS